MILSFTKEESLYNSFKVMQSCFSTCFRKIKMRNVLYSVKHGNVEYTIEQGTYTDKTHFYKIVRYENTAMVTLAGSKSYNKLRKRLDQLID